MRWIEIHRWQAAIGTALLINYFVFGWASTMSKIAAPSANKDYVSIDLAPEEKPPPPPPVERAVIQKKIAAPASATPPPPPPAEPKQMVQQKIEEPVPPQPPIEEFHGAESKTDTAPPLEKSAPPQNKDITETRLVEKPPDVQPQKNAQLQESDFQPLTRLTKLPKPRAAMKLEYPEGERAAGFEASVTIEAFINEAGIVEFAKVAKSGGIRFDQAALNAVKGSKFEPGYIGDKPVPVRVRIPFVFKLR